MNLRPKLIKVIFSILIPIGLFAVVLNVNFKNSASFPQIIQDFISLHNITNVFSENNIILFVIELVIFYFILSIFHRKKQHWNQPIKPLQHTSHY